MYNTCMYSVYKSKEMASGTRYMECTSKGTINALQVGTAVLGEVGPKRAKVQSLRPGPVPITLQCIYTGVHVHVCPVESTPLQCAKHALGIRLHLAQPYQLLDWLSI